MSRIKLHFNIYYKSEVKIVMVIAKLMRVEECRLKVYNRKIFTPKNVYIWCRFFPQEVKQ